jgi:hypothetical protein
MPKYGKLAWLCLWSLGGAIAFAHEPAKFSESPHSLVWLKENCVPCSKEGYQNLRACEVTQFAKVGTWSDQIVYSASYSLHRKGSSKADEAMVLMTGKEGEKNLNVFWGDVIDPHHNVIKTPEVLLVGETKVLFVPIEVFGSAGLFEDKYFVRQEGRWEPVDWTTWADEVTLPPGRRFHVSRVDMVQGKFESPVWKEGDCNACASGGKISFELALERNRVVVKRQLYDPDATNDRSSATTTEK